MKAKIRPNARRGILAGTGNVKISVTLHAKDPSNGLKFKLMLPRGMTVERTATRPRLKPYTNPEIIQNLDGTTALYWLQTDLDRPRKRRFMAKVQVDKCAPEGLAVDTMAYVDNTTNTICTTSLPSPILVRVRYPQLKRSATCAPTPSPSVDPTEPFALFAEGQRFSQNRQLAPFYDRRLSQHSKLNKDEGPIPRFQLALRKPHSITTPEECFEYCSLNGAQSVPLLFTWNSAARQCYCCMGLCTPLVYDPAFDTYKVLVPATVSPTSSPSTPSTTTSTATPTMQPIVEDPSFIDLPSKWQDPNLFYNETIAKKMGYYAAASYYCRSSACEMWACG